MAAKPTAEEIVRAEPADYVCMSKDGIETILKGITTPEEVLRVTQGIDEEYGMEG